MKWQGFLILWLASLPLSASTEFFQWTATTGDGDAAPVSERLADPVLLRWQSAVSLRPQTEGSDIPLPDQLPVMIPVPVTAVTTSQNQMAGRMEAVYCLGIGISLWVPEIWRQWWQQSDWRDLPVPGDAVKSQKLMAFQLDRIRQQSAWNHLDLLKCIEHLNQQLAPEREPVWLQWLIATELDLDVVLTRQDETWQLLYAPRQAVESDVFLVVGRQRYIPVPGTVVRAGDTVRLMTPPSVSGQRLDLMIRASWPQALSEASVGLEAEGRFFSMPLFPRLVLNWRSYPQPGPAFMMDLPLPDVTVDMVDQLLRKSFTDLPPDEAIVWLEDWLDHLDDYADWQLQSMAGLPGQWSHTELRQYLRLRFLNELMTRRLLAVSYNGDWFIAAEAEGSDNMLVNSRGYEWLTDREKPSGHPDNWSGADVFVLE